MKAESLEFDYIIVGAGSAGCVLANGLSADPSCRVLLLEAGIPDKNIFLKIPAGVYRAFRDPKFNWNYYTEPEKALNDRIIFTPRGKVLGGSSSINSMVYMRGHPLDYDRWASECGLSDWSFSNCLPYFIGGENFSGGKSKWRGSNGLLSVTKSNTQNPLYDAFLLAGRQSGQGVSEDLNGYKPEGLSRYDITKTFGERCSASTAFLSPILDRPNLTVLTSAFVKKVRFKKKRATGVSFFWKNEEINAYAGSEVILSGGAINTPQLLMVSGVGPKEELKNNEIMINCNLPGVGQNLQDHAKIRLQFECKERQTIHRIENLGLKLFAGVNWSLFRKGIATSNIWEVGGLVKGNDDVEYPNLQYHFGPVGFKIENKKIKVLQAFSLNVDQMRPKSRGKIQLNKNNIYGNPKLTFNYLKDSFDVKEMIEAVRVARDLVNQPAFDRFKGKELTPGAEFSEEKDLESFLRNKVETAYHPCGTCMMGDRDGAVVDNNFKVHETEGLRVVDASVIPQILSGNLNAPVQMLAARAVDFILGRPQKLPINVPFHFHN